MRVAAVVLVAGAGVSGARADVRKLVVDGTVHSIEVQTVGSGKNTGSAIRHTRQGPASAVQVVLIPGTEDTTIDRDPAMEIDPTGKVIAVWSRFDGTNYNLFASRFNGTSWSTPSALLKAEGDDFEPQIKITPRYVHLSWRQVLGGQSNHYRASFLATTLTPAYGPERINTSDLWAVPPEGDASAGQPEPVVADRFFAGAMFTGVPSDPGIVQVWGVRDEPVPISYRQAFILPTAVRSLVSLEAGFVAGRFTIWYVSGSKLYFLTRSAGAWSSTRSIDLNATTTAADARWLVHDLNARSAAN